MTTNILIIVGHENRIFEIMNDTFNIDLLSNNINYLNFCDIFEISLKNKTINYYENNAISQTDPNNYIYNTISEINFDNPKKFKYDIKRKLENHHTKSDTVIFLFRHSYGWCNTSNNNNDNHIPNSDITDGHNYTNTSSLIIPGTTEVLYNGISLATNTAINLHNYLKKKYNLKYCKFHFASSEYRRAQQTLYYFQKELTTSPYKYDVFPNINEIPWGYSVINHGIVNKNSKEYNRLSNNYFDVNTQNTTVIRRPDDNVTNWNFYNMYQSSNNTSYNFLDNIMLYMNYKKI
jgi:hypothetical protein